MNKLKKIWGFFKNNWRAILVLGFVVTMGIIVYTQIYKPTKTGDRNVTRLPNLPPIIDIDSNTPPVYPPRTNAGMMTNGRPQLIPGQQTSPTATPTAVTINGNVRIENLNLAVAVGGGTAATSTVEKHWYDMPPTRYDKMLDDDGGKKVVGSYEDVIFTKPEGWTVIPEVLDVTLGRDYLALKNKGTHENPDWVDAMNYHYPASEFRVRSLKYPVKVRFVLMPKD